MCSCTLQPDHCHAYRLAALVSAKKEGIVHRGDLLFMDRKSEQSKGHVTSLASATSAIDSQCWVMGSRKPRVSSYSLPLLSRVGSVGMKSSPPILVTRLNYNTATSYRPQGEKIHLLLVTTQDQISLLLPKESIIITTTEVVVLNKTNMKRNPR